MFTLPTANSSKTVDCIRRRRVLDLAILFVCCSAAMAQTQSSVTQDERLERKLSVRNGKVASINGMALSIKSDRGTDTFRLLPNSIVCVDRQYVSSLKSPGVRPIGDIKEKLLASKLIGKQISVATPMSGDLTVQVLLSPVISEKGSWTVKTVGMATVLRCSVPQ